MSSLGNSSLYNVLCSSPQETTKTQDPSEAPWDPLLLNLTLEVPWHFHLLKAMKSWGGAQGCAGLERETGA